MASRQPRTPATRAAAAAAKGIYTVISPLDHDGERFMPGDEIELSEAQAEKLLGHTVEAKTADT